MSASSPHKADSSPVDFSPGEKPVHYILQNLERTYGVPINECASDPLDMLVKVILSQATSDVTSDQTFAALKKRFPSWEDAINANESSIAATVRLGGLSNQKASVIKKILNQIKEEHGEIGLDFLHDMSAADATTYLKRFRGIGPKTIACTLLFACHKDVFPLDSHIFRILRRVGLIPQKGTDDQAHAIMNKLVPAGKFYSFHVNLVNLGRRLCRPQQPRCDRCPIVEYCDFGSLQV